LGFGRGTISKEAVLMTPLDFIHTHNFSPIRHARLLKLLGTTSLVAAGLLFPGASYAQSCDLTAGSIDEIGAFGLTGEYDETLNILACQAPISGRAFFDGIDFGDLNQVENLVTVRGNVDITATSATEEAETRGLRFEALNGDHNVIVNYADIKSTAISTRDKALRGGGATKSFGIFTENWEAENNALFNYGDIYSSVEATGSTNAHEPHGIRMGEWNGDANYFENHGDIVLSGIANGSTGSNSSVVSGGISNQGMNGESNVLLNYGNITSELYGGSGTNSRGVAVTRGINLGNFTNWGQYQYVANYGDMNLYAKGGDNNPGNSFAEAAGILHSGTEVDTTKGEIWTERAQIILENHGDINITLDGPTENNGGYNETWAYGMFANQLDTVSSDTDLPALGMLNNTGSIRMRGTTTLESEADRFIGIGTHRGNENTVLMNSGLIDIQYTSQTASSTAVGMGTWAGGYYQGLIYNSGKIVVRALAEGEAWAIRVKKVQNPAFADINGVEFPDENSVIGLSTLGFLEGKIGVGGHDIVVDAELGHSVYWTAEDFLSDAPSWGQGTGTVFYSADGLSAATFDTSLIASQSAILSQLARAGAQTETTLLNTIAASGQNGTTYALQSPAVEETAAGTDAGDSWHLWATGLGGKFNTDGTERTSLDSSTRYGGLIAGAIRPLLDTDLAVDGALSLSLGALTADTSLDSRWMTSHDSASTTIFAGLAATVTNGPVNASFGLRAGYTGFEHERHVNNNLIFGGMETAEGDQDSYWLNLSGDLGYNIQINPTNTLTPFARVDHLMASIDGYAESGIISAATIGDRDSSLTRATIGLRTAHKLPTPGNGDGDDGDGDGDGESSDRGIVLHTTVGLFGNYEGGDGSVALGLLGQNTDIAMARLDDDTGIFVGFGAESVISDLSSLTANVGFTATEAGDTNLSATLALRMKF
jgi:hypothetical protein